MSETRIREVPVTGTQVAAAKLQIRLDKKAGRPSSPAIRAIAEARPLKNGEAERYLTTPVQRVGPR